MCFSAYHNRRRRAKKRPQGFIPAVFLNGGGLSRSNHPSDTNEMAEVDFGNRSPVTAAHMNRNIGGRNGDSSYNAVLNSPLSPLLPAVTPGYDDRGRSVSPGAYAQRNLGRSLSRNDDREGSILTSPYSDHGEGPNWAIAPLPPLPNETGAQGAGGVTRNLSANGNNAVAGPLVYSDMREFQKALEAEDDKQAAQGRPSQDPGNDPPPTYSMQ